MAAGIRYDSAPEFDREIAPMNTAYRMSGGFNFADANVPNGTYIPPFAPLCIDFTTRKAVAVKCVEVAEKHTTGTTMKVKKGSLAYIGMHVGSGAKGGTIKSIDTSNAAYDTITFTAAFDETIEKGVVLFEAAAVDGLAQKNKANFLNYGRFKVGPGETLTAIGQAFEIKERELYLPISEKDKESLGARFMFV